MAIVEADFSELNEPDPYSDSLDALDLILGVPGEGVFATSPGHPQDNRPRSAVFYPNTQEGRKRFLADSRKLAAEGRNSFLNSAVWQDSAREISGHGLLIGGEIQPLSFPCLWVDVDKGLTDEARELLRQILTRPCVLTYSGGTTPEGKRKFHLRVLLDKPITDVDEFYKLNHWLSRALGGEKYNPVSWLTTPGSTRFKDEYPEGREIEVKVTKQGYPWAASALQEVLRRYAKAPRQHVGGSDAVDLEPVKPKRIPNFIRNVMSEDGVDDRSAATHHLIKLCAEKKFSQEETLWIVQQHEPSMSKYGERLTPREVLNCWPEDEEAEQSDTDLLRDMHNAAVLGVQEFPPLEWMVPEVMPEGLGMVVAPPKAGKSWMVLDIALACATGGKALGTIDVEPRPVLYMDLEGSHRRLQSRIEHLLKNRNFPPDLFYILECSSDLVIKTLETFIGKYKDRKPLVIVDTMGVARGERKANEDGYSSDYQYVRRFMNITRAVQGCSVLLVHHSRKSDSGDFVDAASGTNGIAGAVDYMLHLTRDRSGKEGTVNLTGRDVEDASFDMKFPEARWKMDGNSLKEASAKSDISSLGERSRDVLDYVNENGKVKAADVAENLDMNVADARTYLYRLHKRGHIDKRALGVFAPVS